MQFEITDEAAITFGGRLYEALAQGFPIDAALAQSRKAIFAAGNDIEFGTPVLFLRAADARLFDPDRASGQPLSAPVAQEVAALPNVEPVTVAAEATPEDADEPAVSAAHTGAAATTATAATIPSEPPAIAENGSAAPQKVEAEPLPIHPSRRDSTPAEHSPRADSPSRPAFSRRFSRPWMLFLAGGALAVALVVWLISGSGSHHNPSTTSAGATTVHPAAQWRQLQPLPQPVTAAGVAEYQNEIWVVGGTRDKQHDATSDVYVMDPRGQSGWSRGPRLLEPRAKAAVVSDGAHLYVIGGFGPDGRAVKTVFRLDGPTQQWRRDTGSLPDNRTAGAAAFDGTRIVFAGGNNIDGHPEGNVWALGEDRWARVGMLHAARDQLAAAGGGGKVWFIGGGLGPSSAAASSMVDVVHGSRVDSGTPLAEAVRRPAAVNIGSGFCAIWGHRQGAGKPGSPGSAAFVSGRVQCQGIHGSIPGVLPRVDSGAAVLDDTIYVVGGYDPTQRVGTTTVQALDLRGG
jgi:Kelch motif/Galactose oxidase, central domain